MQDSKLLGRSSIMIPPRQAYSFPLMDLADIILCLNELGISVTKEELLNPDKYKDQIRRVYEYLTELCTGITKDEMSQPAFSGLQQLSYPELHEESIPQINSFRACQKLLEVCGIYDFTIKDLMTPTPKRLKKQLSGILNFAKFREERYVLLTELSSHRDTIITSWNKSKAKNEELQNKLQMLRQQTEEEANIITSVENECKLLESKISELNHLQAEIREDIGDLKVDNIKLKDSIRSKSLQIEESMVIKNKLSSQIVNSPERFRKQIMDIASLLTQQNSNIRTSERKFKELHAWIDHLDETTNTVLTTQNTLNEALVEVNKHTSINAELNNQKLVLNTKRDNLKNIENNIISLQRQTNRSDDKISYLKKQNLNRQQDTHQALTQLNSAIMEADANKKAMKNQNDNIENEYMMFVRQLENDKYVYQQVCTWGGGGT